MLPNFIVRQSKLFKKNLRCVVCLFIFAKTFLKIEWKFTSKPHEPYTSIEANHRIQEWWCLPPAFHNASNYKMDKIEDLENYKGYLVDGWPPERSRCSRLHRSKEARPNGF